MPKKSKKKEGLQEYVRNPVTYAAEQFTHDEEKNPIVVGGAVSKDAQGIHTSVGGQRVNVGDWILTDDDGNVTVVTNEEFEARYKRA